MHTGDDWDCNDCRQLFTALDRGELDSTLSDQIASHLAHCADCSAELQQYQQLFSLLDCEEVVSPAMNRRFAATLQAAAPASAPSTMPTRTVASYAAAGFQRFWPSRPAWAGAYSCALLLCGVLTGQLLPTNNSTPVLNAPASAEPGTTICPIQSAATLWMPAPPAASLA